MPKVEKSFFKITELSEEFARFSGDALSGPGLDKIDTRTQVHFQLILWQIRAQLAMAQQLAIVAKHLGAITAECERAASKAQ